MTLRQILPFIACASSSRATKLAAVLLILVAPAAGQESPPVKPAPFGAVYELRTESTTWTKLFDLPERHRCNSPRVTSDGKRVMFDGWKKIDGETNSDSKIFICNLDGSERRVICSGNMPSPSPDGKRFACSSYQHDSGVWIVNLDGGQELVDAGGWGIQWSSDGGSVAYTRGNNLVVRRLATGEERLLFPAAGSPYQQIMWNPSWSADSKCLAIMGSLPNGKNELAVVDAEGAEFRFDRLMTGDLIPTITWNADSRSIVFPERAGKDYRMLEFNPATMKTSQPLIGIPADAKATSATWTPDGSRLIVFCNGF